MTKAVKTYLIVEDHLMLASLLEKQLATTSDSIKIFNEKNGEGAIKCLKSNYIDVVILDLNLPDIEGINLIPRIREINAKTKIVILSAESDVSVIKQVAKFGFDAYVSKMNNDNQIIRAIESVNSGKRFISDDILELLLSDDIEVPGIKIEEQKYLTRRELEILEYIASQMTSKQIADLLSISRHTVETHKRRMMQKLKVNNSAGLIKVAYDKQLLK